MVKTSFSGGYNPESTKQPMGALTYLMINKAL